MTQENTTIYNKKTKSFEVIDLESGEVLAKNDPVEVRAALHPKYTPEMGDGICELIAEGMTLTKICKQDGMPRQSTIYYWRKRFPDFDEKYELARKLRAEHFHDKIMEVADDPDMVKEDVPVHKLKTDLYKWGASVADPDRYGNKTKISGDPDAPLQIIVDTGIRRNPELAREVLNGEIRKELGGGTSDEDEDRDGEEDVPCFGGQDQPNRLEGIGSPDEDTRESGSPDGDHSPNNTLTGRTGEGSDGGTEGEKVEGPDGRFGTDSGLPHPE